MRIILLTLSLFFAPIYAAEHAIKYVMTDTSVQYGPQTVPSISEQANVLLYGTNVQGAAHVNGNLTAKDAQIGTVVVNGSATLVNCVIRNSISVYGELQMQNCQVFGEVSTYAPLLTLSSSSANSLINLTESGQQSILLQSGSIINGPITFFSGNGSVTLSGGSYISGALSGGRTIRN